MVHQLSREGNGDAPSHATASGTVALEGKCVVASSPSGQDPIFRGLGKDTDEEQPGLSSQRGKGRPDAPRGVLYKKQPHPKRQGESKKRDAQIGHPKLNGRNVKRQGNVEIHTPTLGERWAEQGGKGRADTRAHSMIGWD